ncbi:MAG: Xaa-Pro peptidase family protein [Candidatus Hermodarchaeota archaeon]|nr:Xaa-Pro peptidase family protein [Candidatus Hermodarchaeota archaeon]
MSIPLMQMHEKLQLIREFMQNSNIDAWLIYDFRGLDPTGKALLGDLTPHSRQYALLITADDPIILIKSPIESQELDNLTPTLQTYNAATQDDFMQIIKDQTRRFERIAVNLGENPQTDIIPAGRFMHLCAVVPQIKWVMGENLMQIIHSVLSQSEVASHQRAALTLTKIMEDTFSFLAEHIGSISEKEVAEFMQKQLRTENLLFVDGPMVAVEVNSANPHYTPGDVVIKKNQLVMIDLWAKWDIYADITWMAFTGSKVPAEIQTVWDVILEARTTATAAVKPDIEARIPDDLAREVIIMAGYKDAIMHRTGHSIDSFPHGKGANLDSYEMPESRLLLPNTLVSVEPGIYLQGQFGVRSEIDVLVTKSGHQVTTPPQENLLCL